MKKTLPGIIVLTIMAVAAWSVLTFAEEGKDAAAKKEVKADFIGAAKCIVCHKKDGVGPSWETTAHAKAFSVLSAEQQKNEKCLGCHTTGKLATGEMLEGVQCEACHGAGSLYKSMAIMKDKEKSIANGLIMPNEETCVKCHNDKVAAECKAKPFVFKERVKDKKGVHDMPVKAEAPAGK